MNVLQDGANEQNKPTTGEVTASKVVNERKLRVLRMHRNPIAVVRVSNLQSATWFKDLEIEVKNISDKPLYCILASLTFPDDYSDPSKIALVSLMFGLPKYLDIRVVGNPRDPHLKPGKTCVLRLHEWYWEPLRQREKRFPERLKSFAMSLGAISFGDKTGFTAGPGWLDYSGKTPKVLPYRELSPPPTGPK